MSGATIRGQRIEKAGECAVAFVETEPRGIGIGWTSAHRCTIAVSISEFSSFHDPTTVSTIRVGLSVAASFRTLPRKCADCFGRPISG